MRKIPQRSGSNKPDGDQAASPATFLAEDDPPPAFGGTPAGIAAKGHAAEVRGRTAPYMPPRPSWGIVLAPEPSPVYTTDPANTPEPTPVVSTAPLDAELQAELSRSRGPAAPGNPVLLNGPEGQTVTSLDTVQEINRRSEVDAANHPTRKPVVLKNGGVKTWVDRDREDEKCRKRVVAELRRQNFTREADRVEGCQRVLGIRHCLDCTHDQKVTTHCGMWQLCPTCCRSRGKKIAGQLYADKEEVKPAPGHAFRLLTLPVRTVGSHGAAVKRIGKAFSKLWNTFLNPPVYRYVAEDGRTGGAFEQKAPARALAREYGGQVKQSPRYPAAGAFRVTEFGALNGNVHLHVIYFGPWVDQGGLKRAWLDCTGDSYIVYVQRARNFKEVAKYAVKMFSVGAKDQVTFWQSVRGKHTTQRYGVLRKKAKGEREKTESLTCEVCGSDRYHYTAVDKDGIISHLTATKGFP